ncbi:hypothetical protein H310_11161 [Aphanomyces invadans]|uniref:Uncharacterized protein n=1 Tax=Aphanomyces invadans TaxID=157072 RepID=A0A024TNP4_9STRA|nr:hypothetical protein H310_11161 [Aphanomyces invadans]ETV95256.1 hypothetical protein H310_11161 [Aphanomyces invadans]RHY35168.1 hypothetical protein DYB32_000331 [Aphanomyces invadans]|eukprot:XP_008875957.1 hypothetical protein H310_11161 [Aphanomyces invadans]
MGNDGGVIAVARKFMRHGHQKQRDEKGDQDALREKRTTMCALTDEPLQEPIVACKLGNLFNKDRLIEKLLERSLPEKFSYIRSMKDVVTCKFYPAPEAKLASEKSNMKRAATRYRFHCPITLQLFNGAHRFVVLKKCGCVLSEKALKEVKPKDCLMCGFPIKSSKELWPLLLSDEDAAVVLESIRATEKPLKRKREDAPLALDDAPPPVIQKAKSKLQAVNEAEAAVNHEKERNPVYASLFATEKESKKSANELLMTVAGLRYTLS